MQFTRLRLNGFKSFVDPTDLVIASGLTGVVGPNGCGKSNLLEALRWVMGETRPSAMRGGGMEDVIFAGASTRPARNFAEVILTIDNSERLAPASFNQTDFVEISRRITRDAGSAYKANSKDVRARDVQMLFADASTGSTSPALVRQGQISELINAKPKSRRRILEEAAGISGLYQRRHEAELKLRATETNLERVEDIIDQLSQQLAQLSRQARQAARYREIGTQLRRAEGLLLYRRWREADVSLAEAQTLLTERTKAASQAELAARQAAVARTTAEEALPPLREEEAIASAVLQRLQVERDTLKDQEARAKEQIRILESRLVQLDRDRDREAELTRDAGGTIEGLEEERAELIEASDGFEDVLGEAEVLAHEAAEVLQERESDLSHLTEDVARLAARHQSIERLVSDSRKTLDRSEDAAARAREAVVDARRSVAESVQAQEIAEERVEQARAQQEAAEEALIEAESRRTEMQAEEADARAARSEADGEVKALSAEVSALARLVERDAGGSGQILDETRVSGGYERALGAALGDDLKAPRLTVSGGGFGWADLKGYDDTPSLPDGVAPLSAHVDVPELLSRRLSQIGLVDASDGDRLQPLLRPGQRLVSREGDLWRWDGYCAAAADAPSAAALRLEQMNRLDELREMLEASEARADHARQRHEDVGAALQYESEAERSARDARRTADAALTDASRAMSKAEADHNLALGRVESLELAVTRHNDEAGAARLQVQDAERQSAGLADLDEARSQVENVKMTVEAARITMMSRRSGFDELRREGEARASRIRQISTEIASWNTRLRTAEGRISELASRAEDTQAELEEAHAVPEEVAEKAEALAESIAQAEARKASAVDAVVSADRTLRDAGETERETERTASEAREGRARAETRVEACREAVATAAARIEEELETTPADLLENLDADPEQLPPSSEMEDMVARLRRQRDALGAVNLRAEEDAREVQEEHDALIAEKADLEEAIGKLRAGINGLNREGRERLLTAFEQVNSNFSTLFTHLFGGGEANLMLVESDDPLEAGLEIMCQPPGKKLSTLSLLSGGEQTLTALALIFAVFLANPAPICVLDEVDAPLDDANVTRFCDLLDEMARRTQTRFLIITHHAVTMARMDRLFGVTMAEQGVSQLVSVDLKKAEQLVA
ncbi:chromosome segregation SMC family protein [Qingshengfaniella alkalisoli]|uniref:Chromosome partition protein Smc n=1 Tax=Qingshengfaniella alkalisoli TaxID=2599296 RepID=A0A5B8IWI9_9RHOB|nr:AAA family ATPase [Qingshengfaniella alkalisoli]QDY69893.1 AAA family ATPase [Qingshengfaniella alkalisoli]